MKNLLLLILSAFLIVVSITLFFYAFTAMKLDGVQITVLSLVTGMGLFQGVLFIYFYFLNKKEEWRKTLDNGLRAGIGDIVDDSIINDMCSYIKTHGIRQFNADIYNLTYEKWNNVAYAYIHPCEAMRTTKQFNLIQEAFIRAYV